MCFFLYCFKCFYFNCVCFIFQVECKKAQPKEVMFPTVLANSRVAARAPNGELVFLSPSAPFRAFDPHSAAPRVSDILKPDQSRHFNSSDLYDAVQSEQNLSKIYVDLEQYEPNTHFFVLLFRQYNAWTRRLSKW